MPRPDDSREAYDKALQDGSESLSIPSGTGDLSPISGASRFYGFAVAEDATVPAAAVLDIYDGADSNGELLMRISLVAGETAREWYGPMGIRLDRGLFVDRVTGSTRGSLFYRA